MKKLLFLMISSLATFTLCAQTTSSTFKKFFVEGGGGVANHNGIYAQLGIKGVLKNNWTASISYYSVDADPKNLPSDYEPGATIILFFPIPDPMPSVNLKMVNFTAGKLFQTGRKTWFTAEAGLSIVSGKTFDFAPQPVEMDWDYITSNYSSQEKKKTTVGAMFRADFTWAITRHFGLGAGAFANANSIQSPVGFEIKLLVGSLNGKKVSRK
jgi:hypothetical protein